MAIGAHLISCEEIEDFHGQEYLLRFQIVQNGQHLTENKGGKGDGKEDNKCISFLLL